MSPWLLLLGPYCAAVMGTWCAGAFGIGAQRSDRFEAAMSDQMARYGALGREYLTPHAKSDARMAEVGAWCIALLCGSIWPVAIPLYLAYRKGMQIDDALVKRQALLSKDAAS